MLELSAELIEAVRDQAAPTHLVNPETQEAFVLLRAKEYKRLLIDPDYDASPWTREEREALRWEQLQRGAWQGPDLYDDLPEQS